MRSLAVLVLIVAALAVEVAGARGADGTAASERIAQLVRQLGSSQFEEREAATQALDTAGAAALDALRQALQSTDPEVRRRAQLLLRQVERRLDTARFLAPKYIDLNYRNTPVAEAVADFARRTGCPMKVEGDATSLARRTLTLDAGDTPFWEAFSQLCDRAGLVESRPTPVPDHSAVMGVSTSSVVIINGNMRTVPSDILGGDLTEKPSPLTLVVGKPRGLPSHCAGALRIQAVPLDLVAAKLHHPDGEFVVTLEVTTEPRLKWQKPLAVRIQRAIDDQGQSLEPAVPPPVAPAAAASNTTMIVNGVPYSPDATTVTAVRQVGVRLHAGEKPAKMLRELSGTVSGLVQSDVQPLVTVDKVLDSAGRLAQGSAGAWVKMVAVTRQDDGQVRLRLQVETPPRGIDDGSVLTGNTVMIVNGRRIGPDEEPLRSANFTLVDDKGQPFTVLRAENTGRRAGLAQELELTYQPADGQGEPARFVYQGRRAVVVDVPFQLKDVPLP